MKNENNNSSNNNSEEDPISPQADTEIEVLADLVLESLRDGYKTELEPYEIYAQKLRSHIHSDPNLFRHKFREGYQFLLEALHYNLTKGNKPN